ncbi:hypothetical protein MLD38_008395 [Melastoma candidum]|uniref:Uncharacterized protein n=1 Tax=Melastoma candidum TaxID=119954 RepID=A0ACB9RVF7_9MYRT|nr:hypothetical protein MLD38_008395 [Melastoma candidum]
MYSDYKSQETSHQGNGEPEITPYHGEASPLPDDRTNGVHEITEDVEKQGIRPFDSVISNKDRRPIKDMFFRGNRAVTNEGTNTGANKERSHGLNKKSVPLISGAAYCISSCGMILLNKAVLSGYNFNAGISLMFYQNLISTLIVALLSSCGLVYVEKLNWKLVRIWIPVNLIFVGMLVSGMYSLRFINIAMVTILKNMTNIMTAVGELYLFRKHQNQQVWVAMFLMIISAVTGGFTDLSFNGVGYAWQLTNCVLTASYSLTLRRVMDKAKQATRSGNLNEFSMVLLNNLLSLPFALFSILLFGEWEYVQKSQVIKLPMFWVVATASGLLGLAISFTSMWFLHQTGPTTHSLVGSLNKIPISIAGVMLFHVPLTISNFFSILFGLFAGIFFAKAKMAS